jgi:molecular chaperone DnaK
MIDARNTLDSAAYQVERRLAELGAATPVHEKARAEMLVADARQAIKEEAPMERLRSLTSELQQIYHGLGAASAGPPPGTQPGPSGGGQPPRGGGGDDDVIDAEFTTG